MSLSFSPQGSHGRICRSHHCFQSRRKRRVWVPGLCLEDLMFEVNYCGIGVVDVDFLYRFYLDGGSERLTSIIGKEHSNTHLTVVPSLRYLCLTNSSSRLCRYFSCQAQVLFGVRNRSTYHQYSVWERRAVVAKFDVAQNFCNRCPYPVGLHVPPPPFAAAGSDASRA